MLRVYPAYLSYVLFLLILLSEVLRIWIFLSFLLTHTCGVTSSESLVIFMNCYQLSENSVAWTGRGLSLRGLAASSAPSRGRDSGVGWWWGRLQVEPTTAGLRVLSQCWCWCLRGRPCSAPTCFSSRLLSVVAHTGSSFIGVCVVCVPACVCLCVCGGGAAVGLWRYHLLPWAQQGTRRASPLSLCRSRVWLFYNLPPSLTKGKEETVFTLSPLKRVVVVLVAKLCPTLSQPHGLKPARHLCPWDSPGKNTGVGCHFLLQGIFLSQGSNLGLLHWQGNSLLLSHQGSPITICYLPW